MSSNTVELMDEGMRCLIERLGNVRAERFIAVIQRERFDYTKWQREHFDGMTSDEFNDKAVAFANQNK